MTAPSADLILWGFEHGMEDMTISEAAAVPRDKVAELRRVVALSEHMRTPSMFPDLEL